MDTPSSASTTPPHTGSIEPSDSPPSYEDAIAQVVVALAPYQGQSIGYTGSESVAVALIDHHFQSINPRPATSSSMSSSSCSLSLPYSSSSYPFSSLYPYSSTLEYPFQALLLEARRTINQANQLDIGPMVENADQFGQPLSPSHTVIDLTIDANPELSTWRVSSYPSSAAAAAAAATPDLTFHLPSIDGQGSSLIPFSSSDENPLPTVLGSGYDSDSGNKSPRLDQENQDPAAHDYNPRHATPSLTHRHQSTAGRTRHGSADPHLEVAKRIMKIRKKKILRKKNICMDIFGPGDRASSVFSSPPSPTPSSFSSSYSSSSSSSSSSHFFRDRSMSQSTQTGLYKRSPLPPLPPAAAPRPAVHSSPASSLTMIKNFQQQQPSPKRPRLSFYKSGKVVSVYSDEEADEDQEDRAAAEEEAFEDIEETQETQEEAQRVNLRAQKRRRYDF